MNQTKPSRQVSKGAAIFRLFVYSLIGVVLYFVPFKIGNDDTILVDHISLWLRSSLATFIPYYVVFLILLGVLDTFRKKLWKKNITELIMTGFKLIGLVLGVMYSLNVGPALLMEKNVLPFVFDKVAVSLSLVIPIGGGLLLLMTDYGLMDFIGVFARPIMRPLFHLPGRAAVTAVASFMGSYSLGLIMIDREYQEHHYSTKEAAIIATGFSTVSATFMIIIARTLDIMNYWQIFFWASLFVVFAATAITARLYPLRKYSNSYFENGTPVEEPVIKGKGFLNTIQLYITTAFQEGVAVAQKADTLPKNIIKGVQNGLKMAISTLPALLSIGTIGILLQQHTPIFKVIGYIFLPFTWLVRLPEAQLAAEALSTSIIDMLLPAGVVGVNASLITRFVIAVNCVSEILFFSASIPCMLATKIPFKIKDFLIIWVLRLVIGILVTACIGYLIF